MALKFLYDITGIPGPPRHRSSLELLWWIPDLLFFVGFPARCVKQGNNTPPQSNWYVSPIMEGWEYNGTLVALVIPSTSVSSQWSIDPGDTSADEIAGH